MRILLTGATGQVGWELLRTLAPLGEVIAPNRNMFDLSKPEILRSKIRDWSPDIIVNPAAYTAVDVAEKESEQAFIINADAPRVLAEEAGRLNIPLIHYSTDYVFDGKSSVPYKEEDVGNPLNVYGESKFKGEGYILQTLEKCLIFRTSWIYSLMGPNFVTTMRKLSHERNELSVVNDQIGAPTWSRMIAEVTAIVLGKLLNFCYEENISEVKWGLYHLTASGETSWYDFAKVIIEKEKLNKPLKLKRILTSEYPTPAKRPLYSVLGGQRISESFGIRLPAWEQSLKLMLD